MNEQPAPAVVPGETAAMTSSAVDFASATTTIPMASATAGSPGIIAPTITTAAFTATFTTVTTAVPAMRTAAATAGSGAAPAITTERNPPLPPLPLPAPRPPLVRHQLPAEAVTR